MGQGQSSLKFGKQFAFKMSISEMKEFIVTFNVLADDYEQAVKLSEPICKYFLTDNMCTIESVRLKHPELISNKSKSPKISGKFLLKTFGYSNQKA